MCLLVYKECCKNCLLSKNRIVSSKRAKEVIKECLETSSHFICHKASMSGQDIACKSFYDTFGERINLIRIAKRLNVVRFVEHKDNTRLISHTELNNKSDSDEV